MTPADVIRQESVAQLNSLVHATTAGHDAMPMAAFLRYGRRKLVIGYHREGDWGENWEWLGDYTRRVGADAVVTTTDAWIRSSAKDEPYPYEQGGAPREDPSAGEGIWSMALAYREGAVHVDASVLLPYSRVDDGSIVWGEMESGGSLFGEVGEQIARGLEAPRGSDLAGVVLDARNAGHVLVLVDGKPFRSR